MPRRRSPDRLPRKVLMAALSIMGCTACFPPEGRGVAPQTQASSASPLHEASMALESEALIGGFTDYDPSAKPYAFISSAAIWRWDPGMPKVIYACWENPTPENAADRDLVRQVVWSTWQAQSQLRFQGWQACAVNNRGIARSLSSYLKRHRCHICTTRGQPSHSGGAARGAAF